MKKLIALCCLGLAFSLSAPAFAGAQHEKMKGCNKEAKADGLKGKERKAFMKKCLSKDYELKSGAADGAPAATQQDKMRSCNDEAGGKGLKGADRKAFMSACLKG
ncbi:MAG: PsiF repeat-containing protein [Nitrosomonadales bacterium]|nr:PsiF repeat-containing protein [Nitrosomonadales bacterium]